MCIALVIRSPAIGSLAIGSLRKKRTCAVFDPIHTISQYQTYTKYYSILCQQVQEVDHADDR